MRNIAGNPVSGKDFYGRTGELQRLRRMILNGNHVLLKAPRRVGKSSLMTELARKLQNEGWCVVKADVQGCDDEASFLQTLYDAVKDSGARIPPGHRVGELIRSFRRFIRGIKLTAGPASVTVADREEADWEEAAGSLKSLIPRLADGDQQVLVTLDELPIFLGKLLKRDDGAGRVRRVLDWLRSICQGCGSDVPWILCGSIGLDTFVEKQGLEGTINVLTHFELGAFSDEDARGLLEELAEDEATVSILPDDVIATIIERIGWPVPYYLQLMFHELKNLPQEGRSDQFPTPNDVEAAFQAATGASSMGHWVSRMDDLLSPDAASRARRMLTDLCRCPDGMTRQELLMRRVADASQADPDTLELQLGELLRFLEDDGYLIRDGDRWTFRSFLLREYWNRRFGE